MENDNSLLRSIARALNSTLPNKVRTNNYWLRRIYEGITNLASTSLSDVTVETVTTTYEDNTTGQLKLLTQTIEEEEE